MEKIVIAKILKPQGIKGELKCKPYSYESIFHNLKAVYLNGNSVEVLSSVCRFGYAYILLKGVKTRNDAELLRDMEISVDKSVFDGQILVSDFIGSAVYDEENYILGKIISVEQYGSADILNVKQANGRMASIVHTSDIVKKVLPEQKIVVVDRKNFEEQKIEG